MLRQPTDRDLSTLTNRRRSIAAFTVFMLSAGTLTGALTIRPAHASSLVGLTVHVADTNGTALAGVPLTVASTAGATWSETAISGPDGNATVAAIPDSTATMTLQRAVPVAVPGGPGPGAVTDHRYLDGSIRHYGDPPGTTSPLLVQAHVPAAGGTVTMTLPPLATHTIHVVTEAGQNVSGARLNAGQLVSTEVPGADAASSFRIQPTNMDLDYEGETTGTDGIVTITTYQLEPDEATWFALTNQAARGPQFAYQPRPGATLTMPVGYANFIAPSTTVVLPYVPEITAPAASEGTSPGSATVTATLLQPGFDGTTAPLPGQLVQAWAVGGPASFGASAPNMLAQATTDAKGRVAIPLTLTTATRVVLHLATGSHIAAVVNATPRPAATTNPTSHASPTASGPLRFARISYNPPGADRATRSSLNREWFTVTNISRSKASTAGLTVRNRHGDVFHFPKLTLARGATLRVHTGQGRATSTQLFWGAREHHRWGNRADRAQLLSRAGHVLDTCAWPPLGHKGIATC